MALVKDTNVENVINEATPGGIIKAEHIDTIAGKVLYQKNVQTGDSLPSASGYSEGDIFTVQGGAIYRHNGTEWAGFIPDTKSKITIERPTESGIQLIDVGDIADVYAASVSGDLVVVNAGNYDISPNPIRLKNGVNWKFNGIPVFNVSVTSNESVFYDYTDVVKCHFEGDFKVTNLSGGRPVINTTHLGGSVITGYSETFRFLVDIVNSTTRTITPLNFDPNDHPNYSGMQREDAGVYMIIFDRPGIQSAFIYSSTMSDASFPPTNPTILTFLDNTGGLIFGVSNGGSPVDNFKGEIQITFTY